MCNGRGLSETFLRDLESGVLQDLLGAIARDKDLLLEIRDDYINVYCRGFSAAKVLRRGDSSNYVCVIHSEFVSPQLPQTDGVIELGQSSDEATPPGAYNEYYWSSRDDVAAYVKALPLIKQRIIEYRPTANELEVEQHLMRTCSREYAFGDACNVEYILIDRQIVGNSNGGRADLIGVFWPFVGRRQHQTVPLVVIEVKHLLNAEIQCVHEQLWRYQQWLKENIEKVAEQVECIAQQKVRLKLLPEYIGTLRIDRTPESVRYVAAFVDLNPHSAYSDRQRLAGQAWADTDEKRQFLNCLKIFRLGYAMWDPIADKTTVG